MKCWRCNVKIYKREAIILPSRMGLEKLPFCGDCAGVWADCLKMWLPSDKVDQLYKGAREKVGA